MNKKFIMNKLLTLDLFLVKQSIFILPIEILTIILFIDKNHKYWIGIAANVCKQWRTIIKNKYPNRIPAISFNSIVYSIALIKWSIRNYLNLQEGFFINASKFGNIKILQWLYDNNCPWNEKCYNIAAIFGNLKVLKWLYRKKCPFNPLQCACNASLNGHLIILEWIYNNNYCEFTNQVFISAAKGGNLEIIKWLHSKNCPLNSDVYEQASENGYLNILEYFHNYNLQHKLNNNFNIIGNAILYNHLGILIWAHNNGYKSIQDISECELATKRGNLEILIWLHTHGYECKINNYIIAARHGYLFIIKYLYKNKIYINDNDEKIICAAASYGNHLTTLKWLHKHNFKWDYNVVARAAENNNFEIIKYAIEHNCPTNKSIILAACSSGNLEMLKYLLEHNCPWSDQLYDLASLLNNLEILQYIYIYKNNY